MQAQISVLVIHPKNLLGDLIQSALGGEEGVRIVAHLSSQFQLRRNDAMLAADVALIASSFNGDGSAGIGIMRRIREWYPQTRCILLHEQLDRETVVRAFCNGARGVLHTGSISFQHLRHCIGRIHAGQIWANNEQVHWFVDAFAGNAPMRYPAASFSPRAVRDDLTLRETEIVQLLALGYSNRRIAESLSLSENTIKNYLLKIFEKAGVSNRTEFVAQIMHSERGSTRASRKASSAVSQGVNQECHDTDYAGLHGQRIADPS